MFSASLLLQISYVGQRDEFRDWFRTKSSSGHIHPDFRLNLDCKNTKSAVDILLLDHHYIPKFCLFSVPAPSFFSASSGTVGFFHLFIPQTFSSCRNWLQISGTTGIDLYFSDPQLFL
jgi:hypothetical protein